MALSRRRLIIDDERYETAQAWLLAWDVQVHGTRDRSRYLIQTVDGRLLLHVIETVPTVRESILILTRQQATIAYADMQIRIDTFDPLGPLGNVARDPQPIS